MKAKKTLLTVFICTLAMTGCNTPEKAVRDSELALMRATQTLDSIYANYTAPGTCLLRENYPSNVGNYTATYLSSEEQGSMPNHLKNISIRPGTLPAILRT